jgi:peptidoglycan/LPS O-acetylase OafA/YrhL
MRFIGLDGLRGLMCLWVVIGHSITMAGLELDKDSFFGKVLGKGLAVDVFFIISGFVITLLLLSKDVPFSKYIKQRVLRIFPAYLLFLFLSALILNETVFVLQNFPEDIEKTADRLKYATASLKDFKLHFFTHLFMLHGITPSFILSNPTYTIMGQAWSLTLQFQFFILAPLFIFILRKHVCFLVLFVMLILASSQFFFGVMGHRSFFLVNSNMFFVGMFSAILLNFNKMNKLTNTNFYSALIIFLLSISIYQWVNDRFFGIIPIIIWSICFFIEVSATTSPLQSFYRVILTNRISIFLGNISYSMYCSHMFFLYAVSYVLIKSNTDLAFYTPIMLIAPFLFTVVASYFSYEYIEKYFITFGKNTKKNNVQQRAI